METEGRCTVANFITGSRILFSVILLFTNAFSPTFYALYILAGISDVLDGIVARKLNIESRFGEKLDTIADICFVGVTLYKLLSSIQISIWLWVWIGAVLLIKLTTILSFFYIKRCLLLNTQPQTRLQEYCFSCFRFHSRSCL